MKPNPKRIKCRKVKKIHGRIAVEDRGNFAHKECRHGASSATDGIGGGGGLYRIERIRGLGSGRVIYKE